MSFDQACEILKEATRVAPRNLYLVMADRHSSLAKLDARQAPAFWSILWNATQENGLRVLFVAQRRIEALVKGLQPNEIKIVVVSAKSRAVLVPVVVRRPRGVDG